MREGHRRQDVLGVCAVGEEVTVNAALAFVAAVAVAVVARAQSARRQSAIAREQLYAYASHRAHALCCFEASVKLVGRLEIYRGSVSATRASNARANAPSSATAWSMLHRPRSR